MPRWAARYSSLCIFGRGRPSLDASLSRALEAASDAAALRVGGWTWRAGGTYSLRLRLRVCLWSCLGAVSCWDGLVAVSGETGVALDIEADAGWTGLGRAVVNGGGRCSSRLEAVEETRDSEKVLVEPHGGEASSCMGEGSGVRSLSPAS